MRATGYRPDPFGHRRTSFGRLASKLNLGSTPSSCSMRSNVPMILDQGPTSSCVGHAAAMGIHIACKLSGIDLGWVPSPAEIYRNGRGIDRVSLSQPLTDDGSEPNQVFRAISEYGVRPMKANVDGRNSDAEPRTINDEPKLGDLEEEALTIPFGEYGISSFGSTRVLALRQALAANKPVTAAVAGGSDAFQNYTNGILEAINAQLDHYALLIGYSTSSSGETVFELLNSWSELWGEGGYGRMGEAGIQKLGDLVVLDVKVRT